MKNFTKIALFILLAALMVFAVGCSSNYKEELLYLDEPDDSNLLFYLTEAVDEQDMLDAGCTSFDLTGNPYRKTFLDKRYDFDTVVNNTSATKCHVTYSISKYPQEANRYHVTQITIYDPSIKVYGLTINSSIKDIRKAMKKLKFSETEYKESEDYSVAIFRRDRFAFIFTSESIRLYADYISTDQLAQDDIVNYYYFV